MRTDDLDYELPPERIAQEPPARRDDARLMVLRDGIDAAEHRFIRDLPQLLRPGDLLILNDTRVIPARFYATRESSGGKVEGLYLEEPSPRLWRAMLQSGGRLLPGERIVLNDNHKLELVSKDQDGSWLARLHGPCDTLPLLTSIGHMPLPPYIHRAPASKSAAHEALDHARYQTIYAAQPGAVAAPTAGLHFTEQLLQTLRAGGIETARITLHVGAGTFAPVRSDTLDEHPMHPEPFHVPTATLAALERARRDGGRIIPVGTTSVRAIESLPDPLPDADVHNQTRLLIQPGFRFRFTDGLLTNFHLPRSTLLALVAARIGLDRMRRAYRVAVEERYRFYSYGDAMLILP